MLLPTVRGGGRLREAAEAQLEALDAMKKEFQKVRGGLNEGSLSPPPLP